jgi:peroxiredoxin
MMDKRQGKIRSFLLNAGLIIAVFFGVMAFQQRNMLPADRQVAPDLRGTTLAGEAYDLANAEGQSALVYFFAPWCKICGASAGNLNRMHRWRDPEEFEVVAVALDWESVEDVRAYVERHELAMPVLLADRSVSRQWQIYAYPSYYVLDSQHRIARRDIGYSSQLGLWWRAWTVK